MAEGHGHPLVLIMFVGDKLGWPIFYGSYDIALWRGIGKKSWEKMHLDFMEWKMGMCVLKKGNTLYVFFCVYSLLQVVTSNFILI